MPRERNKSTQVSPARLLPGLQGFPPAPLARPLGDGREPHFMAGEMALGKLGSSPRNPLSVSRGAEAGPSLAGPRARTFLSSVVQRCPLLLRGSVSFRECYFPGSQRAASDCVLPKYSSSGLLQLRIISQNVLSTILPEFLFCSQSAGSRTHM